MTIPVPFRGHTETVPREWIDYNGHMNVAAYALAFDRATDAWFEHLGLGAAYRAASGCSLFALEQHLRYLGEVGVGAVLTFSCRLLGLDDKRLHFFQEMRVAAPEQGGADRSAEISPGRLAATSEALCLHVDLTRRRATPFAPATRARLEPVRAAHAAAGEVEGAGRAIGRHRG